MHAIIVDDEPLISRVLGEFLSNCGHEVFETSNGEEALAHLRAREGGVDLLISDICMPEWDGPSLLHEVKSLYPDINVIFITGNPGSVGAAEALQGGACGYLRKPIKLTELEHMLTQVEEQRRARGAIRTLNQEIASERKLREEFVQESAFVRQLHARAMPRDFSYIRRTGITLRHLPLGAVGGDFVDLRPYGQGKVLIILVDISGHGMPAAFGSVALRGWAHALEVGQSPKQILAGMEDLLTLIMPEEFLATAFCGVYDEIERELTYVLAGHPPPMVLSRAGGGRLLEGDGGALGVASETPRQVLSAPLDAREVLFAYTDGLTQYPDRLLNLLQNKRSAGGDYSGSADGVEDLMTMVIDAAVEADPYRAFSDDLVVVALGPADQAVARSAAPPTGKTVLVYDDDAVFREFAAMTLKKHGYRYETRPSADAWQADIESVRPDLVISDVFMTGMRGDDLLRGIRKAYPQLPVILASARRSDEVVRTCLRENAAGFLRKPFSWQELLHAVQAALRYRPDRERIAFDDVAADWMDFVLTSSPVSLELLDRYLHSLERQPIPPDIMPDLLYCIREIVGNAIEWGNLHQPDFKVRLSTIVLPDRVMVKVSDEGAGFDVRKALTGDVLDQQEERDRLGKRDGGFGLAIVRSKMDSITFNAKGNVVVLRKTFA